MLTSSSNFVKAIPYMYQTLSINIQNQLFFLPFAHKPYLLTNAYETKDFNSAKPH